MRLLDPLAERPVPASLLTLAALTLAGIALPHAQNLDPLLLGFFGLAVAWRLLGDRHPDLLPGRSLLGLGILTGLVLVMLRVPLNDGLLAGTALLLVMLGLKLLEIRSRRDVQVALLLGHFLILTQLLFRPDLWLTLYLLALAALLLGLQAGLARAHFRPADLPAAGFRLLGMALPVTVLLFLFFPRLDGPLWEVPHTDTRGYAGIDGELSMGSIGHLIRSGATAFRVRFLGPAPPRDLLYWRGPVLWRFDGRRWREGDPGGPAPPPVEGDPASLVVYELTQEPSGRPWVFALDMPLDTDGLRQGSDASLQAPRPLMERHLFHLDALLRYRLGDLTPAQRRAALQLPARVDPRVRALALGWRRAHPDDDAAVVQTALAHFREQPFVYTLSPGTARGDPVARFLFETRRGFCEHYAGSMALLMRIAGIPARVVLGYQGGEPNPLADHWVIRQSDAHAWVEVWLPERGWVRVDPTAAVAPERIELGIDPARSAEGRGLAFGHRVDGWLGRTLRQARWLMDALDQRWYRWVVSFDSGRQQGLLQRLGLAGLGRYAPVAAVLAILAALALAWALASRLPRGRDPDPARRIWDGYRRRLRRAGLALPDWLGPRQVLKQALQRWPEQGETLRAFTRDYLALRYGPDPDPALLRVLRRRLRRLRLPKRSKLS